MHSKSGQNTPRAVVTGRRTRRFGTKKAIPVTLSLVASCLGGNLASADPGHGLVYRSLDTVAGGIESLFRLGGDKAKNKSASDEASCDDSCDLGSLRMLHQSGIDSPIYLKPNSHHPAPTPPVRKLPSGATGGDSVGRWRDSSEGWTDPSPLQSIPVEPMTPRSAAPGRGGGEPTRRDLPAPIIRQRRPNSLPTRGAPDGSGGQPRLPAPAVNDQFFDRFNNPFEDDSASTKSSRRRRVWPADSVGGSLVQPVSVDDSRAFAPVRSADTAEIPALVPVRRIER